VVSVSVQKTYRLLKLDVCSSYSSDTSPLSSIGLKSVVFWSWMFTGTVR